MTKDVERLHAVIRFNRDVSFPRFSMKKGERWGFVVFEKSQHRLDAIKNGGRFDFAGGQCLAEDVELIYEGPGDINYSIAIGACKAPAGDHSSIQQTPTQEKSVSTTNAWTCCYKEAEYIDFERELVGFSDEGNSSVDMRLTFVKQGHTAYLTLIRMNDDGNPRDLGDQINLSWEEGVRQLGDSPALLQELAQYSGEAVTRHQ